MVAKRSKTSILNRFSSGSEKFDDNRRLLVLIVVTMQWELNQLEVYVYKIQLLESFSGSEQFDDSLVFDMIVLMQSSSSPQVSLYNQPRADLEVRQSNTEEGVLSLKGNFVLLKTLSVILPYFSRSAHEPFGNQPNALSNCNTRTQTSTVTEKL